LELKAGMFARVEVVAAQQTGVVVPYDAVLGTAGAWRVFVVEGERAQERPVSLGLREGDRVAVLSGVQPGELVVVEGQSELRAGQKVSVERVRGEGQ
jgi:multidrug efflux pump subunit AcrA (membrane-fusion protein)